jgi:hypothetical protein
MRPAPMMAMLSMWGPSFLMVARQSWSDVLNVTPSLTQELTRVN